MFFANEKPCEEFFCILIQLLNKTWREMRATTADFPKVQFNSGPKHCCSFNSFPTAHERMLFAEFYSVDRAQARACVRHVRTFLLFQTALLISFELN
jgi:hypothetical protein